MTVMTEEHKFTHPIILFELIRVIELQLFHRWQQFDATVSFGLVGFPLDSVIHECLAFFT
ncbi:hypothetical protein D3C74_447290 [compost metagenome]